MPKPARGRLYIDKDVQRALLWQLFRHWALFIAVPLGMVFVLQMLQAGPSASWSGQLESTWHRYAPMLVAVIALFPVFVYDSIKLSHRFVGPIMRLRNTLRQAASGEPIRPLQFRQNDFWQDIATNFNVVFERLPEKSVSRKTEETSAAQRPELSEIEPELSAIKA